jgi:heme-degrading monooxygenase HmoA
MVLEIAKYSRAVAKQYVLPQAKGFVDFNCTKVEQSDTYTFHINWETLEDHTIGFRESDLFKWRDIGGFLRTGISSIFGKTDH